MKDLDLKTMKVAKLSNPSSIKGGATTGDDGTVLKTGKPKCKETSKYFAW
ncbi:hypothetical protein [Aquimarina aggregata]|nr:hypothetical protein [Aquimarina aggregata]